jgi:hypothetical protein
MSPFVTLIAAALSLPLAAAPEAPLASGRIEAAEGRFEILGRPVRVGEKIELPEGFIRVEEEGTEDGEVGSFGVVAAESVRSAAPAATAAEPEEGGAPAAAIPGGAECRAERAAYLAELWRESGIEVSDPVALLEGLEGGAAGPKTGFYWFAIATDVFRPLARSSELRSRAERLVRCVNGS